MPKTIYLPPDDGHGKRYSGIDITYTKSRNVLSIGGWYDSFVGIENTELYLSEFFRQLEIPPKKVEEALRQYKALQEREAST